MTKNSTSAMLAFRVMIENRGSTELVQHLEGEFTIGARALLDINFIWFGYINACHNWEEGGNLLVQMIYICRRADSQR